MSDLQKRVREVTQALGLPIAEDRLAGLAEAWEQALAEAELIRQEPTPPPTPKPFDASWSEKR